MKDKNKKELSLLDEGEVHKWIQLLLKVNSGYELDEKELVKLGNGLETFDYAQLPEDIMALINNARIYLEINRNLI